MHSAVEMSPTSTRSILHSSAPTGTSFFGPTKSNVWRRSKGGTEHPRRCKEKFNKPLSTLCTGCKYDGECDKLGFTGFGVYTFQSGTEYVGFFRDGMFHGEGTITYPMGQKMDGIWKYGELVEHFSRSKDGRAKPCEFPDRRFHLSVEEGLRPAGQENVASRRPPKEIAKGCYDTGDGVFDPITKCITYLLTEHELLNLIKYLKNDNQTPITLNRQMQSVVNFVKPDEEASSHVKLEEVQDSNSDIDVNFEIKRPKHYSAIATQDEEKWIVENCRKEWDEATGYRPDLYEHWVSGRYKELVEYGIEYPEEVTKLEDNDSDSQEEQGVDVEKERLQSVFLGSWMPGDEIDD